MFTGKRQVVNFCCPAIIIIHWILDAIGSHVQCFIDRRERFRIYSVKLYVYVSVRWTGRQIYTVRLWYDTIRYRTEQLLTELKNTSLACKAAPISHNIVYVCAVYYSQTHRNFKQHQLLSVGTACHTRGHPSFPNSKCHFHSRMFHEHEY